MIVLMPASTSNLLKDLWGPHHPCPVTWSVASTYSQQAGCCVFAPMRNLIIYLSALAALSEPSVYALHHGSAQLRDLLAFPKYDIQFLNELPLSSSDAARCQQNGLHSPDDFWAVRPVASRLPLAVGREDDDGSAIVGRADFVPMRFSPPGTEGVSSEYLCMMPSGNETARQTTRLSESDSTDLGELDPVEGWQALRHLQGKCLYLKQGWFTYSCVAVVQDANASTGKLTLRYCHDAHIRQFREGAHEHPHPPGGYTPQEDTNYEAYTLGQARPPPTRKPRSLPGLSHTNAARQTSLDKKDTSPLSTSFGVSTSSRYLTQRWSDGSPCDKTGRPREIEVQVHCSMTSTDVIYLVKELAICQYVMVVHSPHLCALPGFRETAVDVESAGIACRQVVADDEWEEWLRGVGEKKRDRATIESGGDQLPLGVERRKEAGVPAGDGKSLKELLHQAMEAMAAKERGDAVEEEDGEVLFLSWDEDGGGMVLDLDIGETEQGRLREGDKDMILKIVKEYLQHKETGQRDDEDAEADIAPHDEL